MIHDEGHFGRALMEQLHYEQVKKNAEMRRTPESIALRGLIPVPWYKRIWRRWFG